MKPSQKKRLSSFYVRKIPRDQIAPPHFLRALTEISKELDRQVGVLIDRTGEVEYVLVGDATRIVIPTLSRQREASGRFRGLRCIHTHLKSEPLSKDDLNDLTFLRLDLMMAVGVSDDGLPQQIHYAHLLPENRDGKLWRLEGPLTPQKIEEINFQAWLSSLEDEFSRQSPSGAEVKDDNKAILVGVYMPDATDVDSRMNELHELARSADLFVLTRVIQRRDKPDPKYLLGQGKMQDLILRSMQQGADLLVFDTDLNPTQSRNLAEMTDLRIMDRTQLILDIFAKRAHSKDGKIQVELAQLKYLLPRLNRMKTAMSRLTGGIRSRGPGETKLEISRRRVRERISRLEEQLEEVAQRRSTRRNQRLQTSIPIISVVGYTNAGKSTLINALTHSDVVIEDRLFSTLDPVSRRLRHPFEREVILTDTVGFLRDLPAELVRAFHSTLEELEDADLLLHVADASDPALDDQIAAVERILFDLQLHDIPRLLVLNKIDLLSEDEALALARRHHAVPLAATQADSLTPLLSAIEIQMWRLGFLLNDTTSDSSDASDSEHPFDPDAEPEEISADGFPKTDTEA